MNIQFQLCGLFVLLLLFVFYKSHRTLRLYKERIFYRAMCIIIASLVMDILSLVVIHFRQILPIGFVKFICKSYVITLIWGAFGALAYVFTDLFAEKKHRKISKVLTVVTLAQSLIIYCLPIRIYDDGVAVYTYGAAVILVYIFTGVHILATLISAIAFYNKLNPRRAFAVILWMVIWSTCAMVQLFNNSLLIVGFASAMGVLILFVVMENPEANFDRGLGCFNSYAMTEYINQMLEQNRNDSILEITFENSGLYEDDGIDADDAMRQILHILKPYNDIFTFKNITLGLVLACHDDQKLEMVGKEILLFLDSLGSFRKRVMTVLTTSVNAFSDMDELFRFLSFIRTEYANDKGQLILANEKVVMKYQEKDLIEKEIADALEEDRIEVFLQPIYSNEEKRFTSAEALVRLRKEDGEFLSPGIFIPIAEESGQILEIGERVFEKVCHFLKNTNAVSLGVHYIEVNLSVVQCEQKDLAKRLIEIAEKYEVDPKMINLEITETASISARMTLLENMKTLMQHGFTFSLDDFGKGESNLMYVVEMPVSIVKLDYDLSKAFFTSSRARHVVRAVVGMAHGMDLKLVAEGIETKEEIDGMYAEKIDYIQGYYYSKPLPMMDALSFFEKENNLTELSL